MPNSTAVSRGPGVNRNLVIGIALFWAAVVVVLLVVFLSISGKGSQQVADNASLSSTDAKLQKEIQPSIEKLDKDPNDITALLTIADKYLGAKQPEKAKLALDRALVINPNNVDALIMIGEAYTDFNQFPAAEESFEKALAVEPNSPAALNAKAVYIANVKRDYQGALALLEKALKADPDGPSSSYVKKNLEDIRKILNMPGGK